jgi:hypothetical protein
MRVLEHRNERGAKVIAFPRSDRRLEPAAPERARPPSWPMFLWWTLAWIVAAMRVHAAAVAHEVFGLEASLAFVVAFALPLVSARQLCSVVRTAARGVTAAPRRVARTKPFALHAFESKA